MVICQALFPREWRPQNIVMTLTGLVGPEPRIQSPRGPTATFSLSITESSTWERISHDLREYFIARLLLNLKIESRIKLVSAQDHSLDSCKITVSMAAAYQSYSVYLSVFSVDTRPLAEHLSLGFLPVSFG